MSVAREQPAEAEWRATIALLRRMRLFAEVAEEDLAAVARVARRRRSPKGTTIIARDDPGDLGFLIVAGTVDVVLESAEGRQFIVTRLTAGDHFGEMALLDDQPRSATVVAATDSALLILRRADLLGVLRQHPDLLLRLLVSLSRRLRQTNEQVSALAFGETDARLARLLLLNARTGPSGPAVEVAQEELAAMAGTTRQTVARIFGDWRGHGYIVTGRRRTIVLDAAALSAVAGW